jgi:hypothetical protein
MALLIPSSRDDNSSAHSKEVVPPLFARFLRDELIRRDFDQTLQEALDDLAGGRFVASLAKFREALTLSHGQGPLERKLCEAAIAEAAKLIERNWRIAEALVAEVTQMPATLREQIEQRRREEKVQAALEESSRAEHFEYLPHLRERLARLLQTYPGEARLESRLQVLNGLLAERAPAERAKNLRRLALFRDRLNATDKPETLHRFRALVAPFTDPYGDDPEFAAILHDAAALLSTYENARTLLVEGRPRESLQICGQMLEREPSSILFRLLHEKAKARDWVAILADSTMQRAQAFAQEARYAAALEELESLRNIDPAYPGLESETLHCAALLERSDALLSRNLDGEPEIVEEEPALEPPLPDFVPLPVFNARSRRGKIAITEGAWNHLKTGLAAAFALLMVVLLLASNLSR